MDLGNIEGLTFSQDFAIAWQIITRTLIHLSVDRKCQSLCAMSFYSLRVVLLDAAECAQNMYAFYFYDPCPSVTSTCN